ncbi:hypothetical protein PAMC26510_28115 [Caballeronia sordidicola]|uniref:Uncharacterized protein n=1 Tax=Caballeronia sordidicola TaxID=196367 RepID=A0A242MCQ1_CABSO|nr:hypothetical protein PAMC26510_28115 [Caballeronia sordidicola]OTP72240.1 hypothetical protein PAMC26577_21065 [Caballeronia sordidicola]
MVVRKCLLRIVAAGSLSDNRVRRQLQNRADACFPLCRLASA